MKDVNKMPLVVSFVVLLSFSVFLTGCSQLSDSGASFPGFDSATMVKFQDLINTSIEEEVRENRRRYEERRTLFLANGYDIEKEHSHAMQNLLIARLAASKDSSENGESR